MLSLWLVEGFLKCGESEITIKDISLPKVFIYLLQYGKSLIISYLKVISLLKPTNIDIAVIDKQISYIYECLFNKDLDIKANSLFAISTLSENPDYLEYFVKNQLLDNIYELSNHMNILWNNDLQIAITKTIKTLSAYKPSDKVL